MTKNMTKNVIKMYTYVAKNLEHVVPGVAALSHMLVLQIALTSSHFSPLDRMLQEKILLPWLWNVFGYRVTISS